MIYFVHGFQSSNTGTTAANFAAVMEMLEEDHVAVNYDSFDNPDTIMKSLNEQIGDDATLIVGHSFGGFLARFIANDRGLPLVMFNPALDAPERFQRLGQTLFPAALVKYDIKEDAPNIPIYLGLGCEDDVVDPAPAINMLEERADLHLDANGSHRPSRKLIKQVMQNALWNPPL